MSCGDKNPNYLIFFPHVFILNKSFIQFNLIVQWLVELLEVSNESIYHNEPILNS